MNRHVSTLKKLSQRELLSGKIQLDIILKMKFKQFLDLLDNRHT